MWRYWLALVVGVQLLATSIQCVVGGDLGAMFHSQQFIVSSTDVVTTSVLSHAPMVSSLISPSVQVLSLSSFRTPSPLHSHTTTQSPYYTTLSPYHTTSPSSYHSTNISVETSLSSIPIVSSGTPNATSPSPKTEPSQDKKFTLLLYTVPPLSFVVVVVIAIFLTLCIRRYRRHRRYRHHLQMPLEEIDSSSEGSGTDDDEMNEQESREAAFVVTHGRQQAQPILAFEEDS